MIGTNYLNDGEEDDIYSGLDDPIPQDVLEDDGLEIEDDSSEESEESSIEFTSYEAELAKAYDDLMKANDLTEAVSIVISANPINNNGVVVADKLKEFMHLQGKTRMVTSKSSGLLVASDVESDTEGDDSGEMNDKKEREARDLIWRFVKYLAERDLSKDSVINRRRKLRHIPALIIFLFSSKMYGLIINCPYLPDEYQEQVKNAFIKIEERKYELVEELARMLEDVGSKELAAKVRDLKLAFFKYEPAMLRTAVEFRDIVIKDSDVAIYKSVRNKYVNITKAITQDVASDLIEVVIDKDAGVTEKLKDKVRAESINEVKKLLKEFAENSDTASKDNNVAVDILLNNV